jgi:hypothetical protein
MSNEHPQDLARDTRGAILIVGIVFGVLMVGALWHVAGIGDAIAWRERAQDAADSAAFENAVWNARGMNVIVAINIVMSLVLAVLVIWRTILILVTVALVVAAILCVVTLGTGCGFAGAVARVEGFMLRNDDKVATNIVRILSAMNAAEVAVASVTPIIGAARGTLSTKDAYDVSYAATESAALLPSINPKGIQTLTKCFKGVKAGKIPKQEESENESETRLGKGIAKTFDFYQTFLSNPRMGIGTSLPVQVESYSVLCQKAGESVLNNLAGVLERMGVPAGAVEGIDKAKIFLGAIVGSLPGLFCAPIGGPPTGLDDLVGKQAIDSCKSQLDGRPRKFVGDSQGNNTVTYEDDDGNYVTEDEYVKKCAKDKKKEANDKLKDAFKSNYDLTECGSPSKVWEWAVNGNVFMRSFAQVEKSKTMVAADDRVLEVADLGKTGGLAAIDEDQIVAHAEIYLDCAKRWMDCKSNAMWQMRWRARLRRIQPAERLVATAIEPGIVATLTQIFNASGDKVGGKLRDKLGIPKILIPKVKDTWYFRQLKTQGVMRGLYSSGAFEGIGAFIISHSDNGGTVH